MICAMLTIAGIGTLILLAETAAKLQDSKLYQQPKHGENKGCFARRNKRIHPWRLHRRGRLADVKLSGSLRMSTQQVGNVPWCGISAG